MGINMNNAATGLSFIRGLATWLSDRCVNINNYKTVSYTAERSQQKSKTSWGWKPTRNINGLRNHVCHSTFPPSDTNKMRDVVMLSGGQGAGLLLLQGSRDMYLDALHQSSAIVMIHPNFSHPFLLPLRPHLLLHPYHQPYSQFQFSQ